MQATDVERLRIRLAELADVYATAKKPTDGSMKVWFDSLREFTIDDILFVLVDLPKISRGMPMPNDVYKACAERRAERAVRQQLERASMPGFRLDRLNPNSPIARRELAKIKAITSKPKGGRDWIAAIHARQHEEALRDQEGQPDPTWPPRLCAYAKALAADADRRITPAE